MSMAFLLALGLLSFTSLLPGCLSAVEGIIEKAEVKQFPGYDGELPSKHYSGYITLGDESFKKHYYYYFVTSERNTAEDPVTMYYVGGPGCSCLTALVSLIGPFRIENNYDFMTNGPKVKLDPFAWTKITNVLVIDAPNGGGYSFAERNKDSNIEFVEAFPDHCDNVFETVNNSMTESSHSFRDAHTEVLHSYSTDDTGTVADMYSFLKKWFLVFPEFLANPFYVAGASYAGVYVAAVSNEIAKGIEEGTGPKINFKGYSLANAAIDIDIETNVRVPFAYHMGFIPDELYMELTTSCKGKYWNNDDPKCVKNMEEHEKLVADINLYHTLCLPCHQEMGLDFRPHEFETVNLYRGLMEKSEHSIYCYDHELRILGLFSPLASRKLLNALPEEVTGKWTRCPKNFNYTRNLRSVIPYHKSLTMKGYRAFVFTGDHDMQLPPAANLEWIKSLNYSIVEKWRPWYIEDQIAGYMIQFDHNILFATFKGAGHVVPEYQPREAYIAHQRWFNGSNSL